MICSTRFLTNSKEGCVIWFLLISVISSAPWHQSSRLLSLPQQHDIIFLEFCHSPTIMTLFLHISITSPATRHYSSQLTLPRHHDIKPLWLPQQDDIIHLDFSHIASTMILFLSTSVTSSTTWHHFLDSVTSPAKRHYTFRIQSLTQQYDIISFDFCHYSSTMTLFFSTSVTSIAPWHYSPWFRHFLTAWHCSSWLVTSKHGNMNSVLLFYKHCRSNFLMISSLWPREFKCNITLKISSHHLALEVTTCKHMLYSNSLFFSHYSPVELCFFYI